MTPAEELSKKKPVSKTAIRNKSSRLCPFNCRLRDVRKNLRLTIEDVSEAVGMSKAGYWELEHGGDPMLTTAIKLATFYGKAIEEIWTLKSATSSTN